MASTNLLWIYGRLFELAPKCSLAVAIRPEFQSQLYFHFFDGAMSNGMGVYSKKTEG